MEISSGINLGRVLRAYSRALRFGKDLGRVEGRGEKTLKTLGSSSVI